MRRVRLGSSAITAVRYDAENRTLDIEFREGHSYRYMHCIGVCLSRIVERGVGRRVLERD
jgi:hypothetical protein